jgi:hypothetical protein
MSLFYRSALAAAAIGLLAGCSQNSESFETVAPDSSRNIYLMEVGTPTKSVYRKGEPLELEILIGSTNISAEHVTVDFSLIEKAKWAQLENDQAADTIALGDAIIESLEPGFTRQSVTLTVPNALPGAGDYLIVAAVDAAQSVAQDTNFADNISRGIDESLSHPTVKQISVEDAFINDLEIVDAVVAEGFVLLEAPTSNAREQDGDAVVAASATTDSTALLVNDDPLESDVIGHIDVRKLGADAMDARIEVDVIVNGETFPGYMWDGQGEWVNEAPYAVPSADETHYVPWDIRLVEEQRAALWNAFDASSEENVATFRFRIAAADGVPDENPNNNQFELEVPFRFFDPLSEAPVEPGDSTDATASAAETSEGRLKQVAGNGNAGAANRTCFLCDRISYYAGFSQTYGDTNKFAARVNMYSRGNIRGNAGTARLQTYGKAEVWSLGNKETLAIGYARGSADVVSLTTDYKAYVKVLDNTYLDQEASLSGDYAQDWNLSWQEEVTLGTARFFVGPIPLSVSGGVSGSLAFGAELESASGVITAGGEILSVSMSGFAEGGVDVGFASGGIGVELLVLANELSVTGTADLSNLIQRQISMGIVATNTLEAIEGEFFLFANYPVYKFCCSTTTGEARKTLYDTPALYSRSWNLLNASRTKSF